MREIQIVATVEFCNGGVRYITWTNRDGKSSIRGMKARIRLHYRNLPNVRHVGLGNAITVWSFGAH